MKLLQYCFPTLLFILSNHQAKAWEFICPSNITIACYSDLSDLNYYGKAYTIHNGYTTWIHDCKTVYKLSDCGLGTITRTWGVEDTLWRWVTCSQVITLSNANAFTARDISWPMDITLESCDPDAEFRNLAKPYDKPYYSNKTCTKPMYSYKDTWFRVDSGCRKLLREWKVIDWCTYDPLSTAPKGSFTYTQTIKLVTNDPDAFILTKKDTIVYATEKCDGARVLFDDAKLISKCKLYHTIRNTSKYADASGANPSGFYPIGTTKFEVIAEFACGVEVKCQISITVKQKIQPTPYCLTGVIIELMPIDADKDGVPESGMIDVWASDLNKGSFHKCPNRKLVFSFSKDSSDHSRTFTCDDVGEQEVEIWVTDDLGNQDYCKSKIIIQKNMIDNPNCKGKFQNTTSSLQLKLVDQFGKAFEQKNLYLMNSLLQTKVYAKSQVKNQSLFDGLHNDRDYTIYTDECDFEFSCINKHDISMMQQIINGLIVNPLLLIAADINSDQIVDAHDLSLLSSMHFMKNDMVILPKNVVFTDVRNPWKSIKPDHNIVKLSQSKNLEYILIRKGDLSILDNKSLYELGSESTEDVYKIPTLQILHGRIIVKNSNPEINKLFIYNNLGILVQVICLTEGITEVNISNIKLAGSQILYYRFDASSVTGKILLLSDN